MSGKGRLDGAKCARPADPGPADAVAAESPTSGVRSERVVCYCGLYDACPHWDEMTEGERRACSADKRMTMESLWKVGVRRA
jgi:hypothetical protein